MRTSMPSSLTTRCLLAFPLVLGAVGAASVGSATTLPGKGPATSECYVVLQATGASGKPKKDRDTDTLVCTPFPAGQTCPLRGPVTTTTLPTNVVCEPLVRDGQGIPGTYLLLSVKGPYLCQQSAQQNRFGPCNCSGGESVCADPAHCGPGQETCVQTPFAVADGQALAFPPGSIKTVFSVAAEAPPPTCTHTAAVTSGNPDTPCPGIPGCQWQGTRP